MNFPVNLPVFRGIIPVIFRFIWKGSRGTTPSLGDWTFRLTRNTLQTLWSGLFSAVVAGGPLQYLQGLGQEALQSQAAFLGVREREYQHIYYLTIFARCLLSVKRRLLLLLLLLLFFLFSHEAFTCSFGPSQRPNCRENRWSISCQS